MVAETLKNALRKPERNYRYVFGPFIVFKVEIPLHF